MPLPHRDPAITAFVRHVVIGLDNSEPTKVAARLGVSGAWVVNVRDGHRGVGLDALRKIADADFGGSLDRLEAAARTWAAEHPEALESTQPQALRQPVPPRQRPAAASSGQQLENLRAARERLLDRGYPRDAVNEALLSSGVRDTSDILLVFDLAERHLIAHGYAAQLHRALRQGPGRRPQSPEGGPPPEGAEDRRRPAGPARGPRPPKNRP